MVAEHFRCWLQYIQSSTGREVTCIYTCTPNLSIPVVRTSTDPKYGMDSSPFSPLNSLRAGPFDEICVGTECLHQSRGQANLVREEHNWYIEL